MNRKSHPSSDHSTINKIEDNQIHTVLEDVEPLFSQYYNDYYKWAHDMHLDEGGMENLTSVRANDVIIYLHILH